MNNNNKHKSFQKRSLSSGPSLELEASNTNMEMEQLLSMGFPNELAAEALAATGGKSTLKATEWILSHRPSNPTTTATANTSPTPGLDPPNPSPFQPKLDRFFRFQPKPEPASASVPMPHFPIESKDKGTDLAPVPKRFKPSHEPLSDRMRPCSVNDIVGQDHLLSDTHLAPVPKRFKPGTPHEPLSERMRPRSVNDIVGQDHLLSPSSLLRSAIDCNRLPSIILWGPPGTGKTSIAKAIVNSTPLSTEHEYKQKDSVVSYRFVCLSAVTSGVKDVRDVVEDARKLRMKNSNKRTVLFVDEVHRFNKSQQDSFLPVIEDGSIVFIGATTENPSFHLITPLLSRCRVLTLNPLKPHHVETLLKRAVDDADKGLAKSVGMIVEVNHEAIEFLSSNCDGDARVALNALEISATRAAARVHVKQFKCLEQEEEEEKDGNLVLNEEDGHSSSVAFVTLDDAKEAFQSKHLAYDRAGEEHYNLISAVHKSMRGGDADAAIYWLARMLEGGEQPLYIARRLIRFASEDVGLADPLALNQAVSCYQACHFLGMPECNVILAQCVAYLALAPKSVSVYRAIEAAQKVVRDSVGQNEGVPLHLRNAPTKLMKELGYGKGYIYTPDNPSAPQSYLPPSLQGYKFLDWPHSNSTNK